MKGGSKSGSKGSKGGSKSGGSKKRRIEPAPKIGKEEKKVVKPKNWKLSHQHLFPKRPKNFAIGRDILPKGRDLTRYVKWPTYIRVQRQYAILKKRLKVPPAINQFSHTLDKNHADTLFRLLMHYRPESHKEKYDRLLAVSKAEARKAKKEAKNKDKDSKDKDSKDKGKDKDKDKGKDMDVDKDKDKDKEKKDKEKKDKKDKKEKDKKAKDKKEKHDKEKKEEVKEEKEKGGKPLAIKYGMNHVTRLIEKKKAKLVVIAHDVDPIELVVWLPALCRKMEVPYCIVKSRSRLGTFVNLKTAPAIVLTEVKKEHQVQFDQLVAAVKSAFNDNAADLKKWGGGIMGQKTQNRIKKREKALQREKKGVQMT